MKTAHNSDRDTIKSLREEHLAAHRHYHAQKVLENSGKATRDDVEKAAARLSKALEENAAFWNSL